MAKKINTKKIDNGNELLNFIKIIIIVSMIFVGFYILTYFINKEEATSLNNSNSQKAEIQYYEILIGNIFKQQDDNYYVLIKDINDIQNQVYEAYASIYMQKTDSKGFYLAVMNNMLNSKYISGNSNIVDDINEFKVSTTTLIEISNGKIINKYETKEEILNILTSITK